MKLTELYTSILAYCGMTVKPDGLICFNFGNPDDPVLVDEKKLFLPIPDVLKRPANNDIIFHPFVEYVNRGESNVVKMLRRSLYLKINCTVVQLVDKLLAVLESTDAQKNMNAEQRELMKAVSGSKRTNNEENIRLRFSAFLTKRQELISQLFVSLYLKKNGTLLGEKHTRVGVSTFMIYKQIDDAQSNELTKDQKKVLKELIAFIFPGSDDETSEDSNGYSDSSACPWLDCLLNTASNLTTRINELFELYTPLLGEDEVELKNHLFNHDWMDEVAQLEKYRKEILLIPSHLSAMDSAPEEPAKPAATVAAPRPPAPEPERRLREPERVRDYDRREARQAPEPLQEVREDGALDLSAALRNRGFRSRSVERDDRRFQNARPRYELRHRDEEDDRYGRRDYYDDRRDLRFGRRRENPIIASLMDRNRDDYDDRYDDRDDRYGRRGGLRRI